MTRRHQSIAVIGGGWAGLAAAVEVTRGGHHATLFEMAPRLGGRARQVDTGGMQLDNGQHIMIGAYSKTLELMAHVGVDAKQALMRTPLRIVHPDGRGLSLGAGHPMLAFTMAVMRHGRWSLAEKWALLRTAGAWAARRFRCAQHLTVEELIQPLPVTIREELLDPLCVAALNTSPSNASAQVFLRVLQDALFGPAGSADLLLPRWHLGRLWPEPASTWLVEHGAALHLSTRVDRLTRIDNGWQVDGQDFNGVVVACTAVEAGRLLQSHAPDWARLAQDLPHEPIVTVYAKSAGGRLPEPMMALRAGQNAPAQFVFDLGRISGMAGVLAFVVSAASPWIERGSDATMAATLLQGQNELAPWLAAPLVGLRSLTEKRATFLCRPLLPRPPMQILPKLAAAGDYVEGPYPATLEGAMRSGTLAAAHLMMP